MSGPVIETELTRLFGIKHPVILAGMNVAAGPKLAAAVTNAGGLGVIGGIGYTPAFLKKQIQFLKEDLDDKNAPFGVDLLLPKVGKGARPTNYDYTEGKLPQLIDVIIESGAALFVSAVGVPPKWAVDKLHQAGIPVMNMIGSPKHVAKCVAVGVDIICAQGGEGGGHTGEISTSILVPAVVDLCRKHTSPLTGKPVQVVAAGGIYEGRGLAMALAFGASAVWVGTRFVASEEAGAPARHKEGVVNAGVHDTMRSIVYTGRPMRIIKNKYALHWEQERRAEMMELTAKGVIPVKHDMANPNPELAGMVSDEDRVSAVPLLSGQVAGLIDKVLPAKEIVDDMVRVAVETIHTMSGRVSSVAKL